MASQGHKENEAKREALARKEKREKQEFRVKMV